MNKICAVLIGKFKDKFKVVLSGIVPKRLFLILGFSEMLYKSWGLCLLRFQFLLFRALA